MTSIITGSEGFIAKKLIERLQITEVDCLGLGRDDLDLSVLPLKDFINSEKESIECIFHLAARTFVPDAWEEPEDFIRENIVSTLNILNYCRLKSVPLIYLSAYVYGKQMDLPIKENSKIYFSNPYAQSKILCEEICKYYVEIFSMDITILRPFNVYGINQGKNFLIPEIIDQLKNSKKVVVNSLEPRRDYIYIDDLVEAIIESSKKVKGLQIYNIGSGTSYSVKNIIELIGEILGQPLEYEERKIIRNIELMDVVADISKAHKTLSWKPKTSLKEGLTEILIEEGLCSRD